MKLKLKNPLMQISAAVSTLALSSSAAYAQGASGGGGATLSNMVSTGANNIYSLTTLISVVSYTSGTFFAGTGLLALKKSAEGGGANEPVHKGVGKIAVGAALVTLPSIIQMAIGSMGISENQGVGVTGASTNRLGSQ